MIKDISINYAKMEFWIGLFFQKVTLIIATASGLIMIFRALNSQPFEWILSVAGSALIAIGVVVEYLISTKKSPALLRRIKALEERSRKTDNYIIKLTREVMTPPSKETKEEPKTKKK